MSSNYCHSIGTMLLLLLFLLDPITNNAFAFAFTSSPCSNRNVGRTTATSTVLEATSTNDCATGGETDRKNFLVSVLSATATTTVAWGGALPEVASAKPTKRYVLDEDTGDYVEVIEDDDWQKEWKSRYDQMTTMSPDEIFEAARGAGNVDSKDLENESPASKKRRAFSGCRDKGTRAKLGNISEKTCSKRVLEGEVDFVLKVL